jgi:hypothetical protein
VNSTQGRKGAKKISSWLAALRELSIRARTVLSWHDKKGFPVGKFRDGKTYRVQPDGSIRRVSPVKPWRNKAERKQVLRQRREDRALAAANMAEVAL